MDTSLFSMRRLMLTALAGGLVALLSACANVGTASNNVFSGKTSDAAAEGVQPSRNVSCNLGFGTCVPVVVPPAMPEAARVRVVAVTAEPSTKASTQVAAQLENTLSKVRVNEELFYTIVRPGDPKAEGVFEVTVDTATVNDSRTTETRCRDSKKILCLKESEQRTVSCTERKATVGATVRLRVRKDNSTATHKAANSGTSKACQGESGGLTDSNTMMGDAIAGLSRGFSDTLAIRTEIRPVRMMTDEVGIRSAEAKKSFATANAFMRAGRLDRSCAVYQEMIEAERNSVALFFNAGFCAEARGDWATANSLYRAADQLTTTPNSELASAIKATQNAATFQDKSRTNK